SGTGNMKFALNGALTIGTLDGANVEIRERVGADNFFLFGLTVEEVFALKSKGYDPRAVIEGDPELKQVIDQISAGVFSDGDPTLFEPIIRSLLDRDEFLVLADYRAYVDAQDEVEKGYRDVDTWTRKSILNAARCGFFSSDRAMRQYAADIWKVEPLPVR
ncbi:MAG: glycogen/starch/alpha-glucan phosphorylase, partial [Anaerolineales bacterium]|nr:glycogen/starch/alpha-glucan phosphorylase [Anaerolineales bacterium]